MKVRLDFVTNSSSSSFIYALKGEIDQPTKEALAQLVIDNLLGEKVLSKDATSEEVETYLKDNYLDEDAETAGEIREAVAEGKDVYAGWVHYEECEYSYGDLFESALNVLKDKMDSNYKGIQTDLSY